MKPQDRDELRAQEAFLVQETEQLLKELEGRKKNFGLSYYHPNVVQLKAHNSKARTIVFCGGNRSGKSTYGVTELSMHLTKQYPDWYPVEKRYQGPIKAVISATSFAIVQRVIEPKIMAYLPRDFFTIKRTAQGYLSLIRCKDGSSVDILTLEMDDMAYQSADWDFAWLDEPQHHRKWLSLKRGLVDRGGRAVITMTPLTEPWMKEEIVDRADGKRIEVFTANIRDNKKDVEGNAILLEENIQEFEDSLPEDYREAMIHGNFFHSRGVVYKMFCDEHLKTFAYEGQPAICVLDPHDRLPHHLIWAFVDRDGDIFVDTEMQIHCELPVLADKILEHEKTHKYQMKKRAIDPNFGRKPAASGSNYSVIQELGKHGVRFYEPCDDVELGHMIVRDYLNFDRTKPVTAVNKPKLFFSRDRVPKTIKSMRNLQYEDWQGKTKEDKNPKEVEKEKDNHGADTVRYLCIDRPKFTTRRIEFELETSPY